MLTVLNVLQCSLCAHWCSWGVGAPALITEKISACANTYRCPDERRKAQNGLLSATPTASYRSSNFLGIGISS